jgi:transcriptional regulator with XRE-family HTH domain
MSLTMVFHLGSTLAQKRRWWSMADDSIGSALIRRVIGRRFEALRTKAGLSQEAVAKRLDRGRSTVGRIEDGDERIRFRVSDVEAMLDLYNASGEDRAVLLALTAETRNGVRKSWWHDYTATQIPQWFGLYVSLEESARIIRQHEPELVPGLLQTKEYAEQIMRVPPGFLGEEEARGRVDARMERQTLLTRPQAPRLEVVLSEGVICRTIGMGNLARAQLQHLLAISQQPNVDLRMLPWAAGVHGGMASSGGFSLLSFPSDPISGNPIEPPLGFVDSPTGAMYLTKPAEVSVYDLIWADLRSNAVDQDATRKAITTALEGLTP